LMPHPDNTGLIYIGTRANIATDKTSVLAGFPLLPGVPLSIEIEPAVTWFHKADKTGQYLSILTGGIGA
jgi:hypothetical protein